MVNIATKACDHVADRGLCLDIVVENSKGFANVKNSQYSKWKERFLGNMHCCHTVIKLKY